MQPLATRVVSEIRLPAGAGRQTAMQHNTIQGLAPQSVARREGNALPWDRRDIAVLRTLVMRHGLGDWEVSLSL
eukprot:COSAG03_NODE_17776_length_368_cov_0.899628_1_plen_73_part_01